MTISPLTPATTPAPARGGSPRAASDAGFGALVEHHLAAVRAQDDASGRADARAVPSRGPGPSGGREGKAAVGGQPAVTAGGADAPTSYPEAEGPVCSAAAEDDPATGQAGAAGNGSSAGRAEAGATGVAHGACGDSDAEDQNPVTDDSTAPAATTAAPANAVPSTPAFLAQSPVAGAGAVRDGSTDAEGAHGAAGPHAAGGEEALAAPSGQIHATAGLAGTATSVDGLGSAPVDGAVPSDSVPQARQTAPAGAASAAGGSSAGASAEAAPADAHSADARTRVGGDSPVAGAGANAHTAGAPTAASSAVPAAAGSPSVQGNAVTAQVFDHVTRLVSRGDGTHRLMLRLHPADLGEVKVVLTVRNNTVDVTLSAGPAARDALREGSPQLRSLLELTGASTGQVVVRDHAHAVGATQSSGTATWNSGQQPGGGHGGQPGQTPGGSDSSLGGDGRPGNGRADTHPTGHASAGGSDSAAAVRRTPTTAAPTPARVGAARLDLDL